MGYILPVNSYRSQQYANRVISSESSNYSRIAELQHVGKVDDLLKKSEEAIDQRSKKPIIKEEHDAVVASNSYNEVIGYVNPNPANISIENMPVVQKGLIINAYI